MKLLYYLLAGLISSLVIYNTVCLHQQGKVVYIDIGKLVENYKLKQDLDKEMQTSLLKIKNAVDSLKFVSSISAGPGKVSIDSSIYRLEMDFSSYYENASEKITSDVWGRLNPALRDFGNKNGYKIILGANGVGNVLYAEESCDVTSHAISYINSAYAKGN